MDACPDTFIGPICNYEIAMLGGPPSLADSVTHIDDEHSTLLERLHIFLRNALVDRATKHKYDGVFMF